MDDLDAQGWFFGSKYVTAQIESLHLTVIQTMDHLHSLVWIFLVKNRYWTMVIAWGNKPKQNLGSRADTIAGHKRVKNALGGNLMNSMASDASWEIQQKMTYIDEKKHQTT